jgi:integrase
LKPKAKAYTHADPLCPGHYVRVMPTGFKSYVAVSRDPSGKQKWVTLGNAAHLSIDDARAKARQTIAATKDGREAPQSFASVSQEWFKRHVGDKKLVSGKVIRSYFDRYFIPEWTGRDFESIRRSDVYKMLDKIKDNSGPSAHDHALAYLSGLFGWYALRNESYGSPIIKGMRLGSKARDRILSDDEIRELWKATGNIGDLTKLLLLTAQRRDKVASMRWEDIRNGTWHIPNGDRSKGTGGDLVLPVTALDIINARPRYASNPYVFAARGDSYWQKFSGHLDEVCIKDHWTLHDLRRTARSLMSRAGVRPDIAERVMGHAIGGVEGIYDRHRYTEEKGEALRKLASLIADINKVIP